jgi:hypothetical protein
MPNEQQQIMHNEFAHALEESLGFKYTPLSLSELWEKTKPKIAGRKTLHEYMEKVCPPRLNDDLFSKRICCSQENTSTSTMAIISSMITGFNIRRNLEESPTQVLG